MKRIYVFFISCLLWGSASGLLLCQEETPPEVQQDTIDSIQRVYGLRLGVDLAKPIRTFIDDSYSGVEITADFRFRKRIFLAAELGTESNTLEFPTLTVSLSLIHISEPTRPY